MRGFSIWLRGMAAACIGGASNAAAVVFVDPEHFNWHDGLSAVGKVASAGAIIALLGYLKTSPLPGDQVPPDRAREPAHADRPAEGSLAGAIHS